MPLACSHRHLGGSEPMHRARLFSQSFLGGIFEERPAPPAWFHWSFLFLVNLAALWWARSSILGFVLQTSRVRTANKSEKERASKVGCKITTVQALHAAIPPPMPQNENSCMISWHKHLWKSQASSLLWLAILNIVRKKNSRTATWCNIVELALVFSIIYMSCRQNSIAAKWGGIKVLEENLVNVCRSQCAWSNHDGWQSKATLHSI